MKPLPRLYRACILSLILVFVLSACQSAPTPAPVVPQPTTAAPAQPAQPATQAPQPTAAPAKPAASQPVEVVFAMNSLAAEIPGWTAVVDEANKQLADKNIKIKVQNVAAAGWGEYTQKIVAQFAAGTSPDIGRIAESQLPMMIDKNYLADISDVVSGLSADDYFQKTFQGTAYRDGKYYGLPSGVYHMVMYYNKDLFDKAGLSYPSADWNNSVTFAQVADMAKKLTSGTGANKVFGFNAGTNMAFIGMYGSTNGGVNVANPDGTCGLTDPKDLAVYNWFDQILRTDKSMPTPTETSVVSAFDMFTAGRIAMDVDGSWMQMPINSIKGFKVGIAAVPSADGKARSAMFTDAWIVFKGSKHPAEAKEALKAIYSVAAFDALAKTGVGGVPIAKATLNNIAATYFGPSFSDQDKQAFIQGLDHTQNVPYNSHYDEIDSKANAVLDNWLLGNVTSQDYAKQVCDIWNTTMKQP
jgi:ABC-type glycerol-3-phosphate transport system substrate-binding protein